MHHGKPDKKGFGFHEDTQQREPPIIHFGGKDEPIQITVNSSVIRYPYSNANVPNSNAIDLHSHGHHGSHHKTYGHPGGERGSESNQHHKSSRMKKVNPYKEWLDKLPFMTKNEARAQAQSFWNAIIVFFAIWNVIFFAL